VSLKVFLISGLFADKHHTALRAALSEDSLGCVLPKITATASFRCRAHVWNGRVAWDVASSAILRTFHDLPPSRSSPAQEHAHYQHNGLEPHMQSSRQEENMPSKNIPPRKTKIAEQYAQKVRMEPPKATRQEAPLVAKGKVTARQHNMKKSRISRRSPS
jgi:hypothetical protein